jgi:ATP-dependent Clp protease protease subunit
MAKGDRMSKKDSSTDLEKNHAEAEIKKLLLEAQKIDLETQKLDLEIKRLHRVDRDEHADADQQGIYTFYSGVDKQSVQHCMKELGHWSRRDPHRPFTVIFNSPGGSVIDGFALYDYLRELSLQGHHITTIGLGYVASMGGILMQAGDHRILGQNTQMLIHEVSSVGVGKVSEMEDELKFVKRLQEQCLEILALKSTMTVSQIKRKWTRKDWWLNSSEAHALGFCDEIR